jgi:uncharacterized protein
MMRQLSVDLHSISPEGVSRRFSSPATALGIDEADAMIVHPLTIACQFVRINREVVVQGTLRSAVRLSCSRCAEEFVLPLTLALKAIYLPVPDLSSEQVRELEDDLTDVYSYTESVIDLSELVRDKLLLAMPLQPYCMAGCKGLCPACGVNRNMVRCQCAEEKFGSPFDLLKGLRFS